MVLGGPPVIAARRAVPLPDTVSVEVLGELPSQFSDRFITGVEYAGRSDATPPWDAQVKISPDGLHLAFIHDLGNSMAVVLDGVRGREYGTVWRGVFSREGGHFAHFASPSARGGTALVLDGQEFPVDDEITLVSDSSLVLSTDGQHFAYVGANKSEFRPPRLVVSDKGPGRAYDAVGDLAFGWDGAHLGYVAQRRDRYVVVVDEVESPEYLSVRGPVFDFTGRHVMYTAGGRWPNQTVRDGGFVDLEEGATDLHYSRDGRHRAHVIPRGTKRTLVLDGKGFQAWERIQADTSFFSPDGDHTAFWGARGASWILVVDGNEIWEQTEPPSPLQFTGDGKHVVHTQRRGWKSRVIVDATPGAEYDFIGVPQPGNSGRFACVVRDGHFWKVVVDSVEGPAFESVGDPKFSLDGIHVAYCGWVARERACVIVDGQRGPEFEAIIPYGPAYHPDGTLEYLALRGLQLLRVRHVPR
jgi:hypothetical protein